MIVIEQGSNSPIRLDFAEDFTGFAISAGLYRLGEVVKSWSTSNVRYEGKTILLPLEESETLTFSAYPAKLVVKFLDNDGKVLFCDAEKVYIKYNPNKTPLTNEEA